MEKAKKFKKIEKFQGHAIKRTKIQGNIELVFAKEKFLIFLNHKNKTI
jgi:hypothetical protein